MMMVEWENEMWRKSIRLYKGVIGACSRHN